MLLLKIDGMTSIEDKKQCREFLKETIENLQLSLLPRQKEVILKCMQAKDYYLIQGPPGTGKSLVLGIIMYEELFCLNHNVVVIAPNHMAINNALAQIVKLAPSGIDFVLKVGQAYNAPSVK